MGKRELTTEQFLSDVKDFQMRIKMDNGVYRHVYFGNPETGNMSFSLVTWPGFLCMSGDMGEFVFERLEDMFQFFMADTEHRKAQAVWTNPGYWGEKLRAGSSPKENFDRDTFVQSMIRSFRESFPPGEPGRWETWNELKDKLSWSDMDSLEQALQLAYDFEDWKGDNIFHEPYEWAATVDNPRYIWACHAISWGVNMYWKTKELETPEA